MCMCVLYYQNLFLCVLWYYIIYISYIVIINILYYALLSYLYNICCYYVFITYLCYLHYNLLYITILVILLLPLSVSLCSLYTRFFQTASKVHWSSAPICTVFIYIATQCTMCVLWTCHVYFVYCVLVFIARNLAAMRV